MKHHLRKSLCCKRNKIFQYLFKEKVKKNKTIPGPILFLLQNRISGSSDQKMRRQKVRPRSRQDNKVCPIWSCPAQGCSHYRELRWELHSGPPLCSLFLLPHGSSSTRRRDGLQHSSFSELTSRSVQAVCSCPCLYLISLTRLVVKSLNGLDQIFEGCMKKWPAK